MRCVNKPQGDKHIQLVPHSKNGCITDSMRKQDYRIASVCVLTLCRLNVALSAARVCVCVGGYAILNYGKVRKIANPLDWCSSCAQPFKHFRISALPVGC